MKLSDALWEDFKLPWCASTPWIRRPPRSFGCAAPIITTATLDARCAWQLPGNEFSMTTPLDRRWRGATSPGTTALELR